jgi:hypothetical protein
LEQTSVVGGLQGQVPSDRGAVSRITTCTAGWTTRSFWSIFLGAESGPRALFEQGFAPVARRLGWRPEFRWGRLAQWAERHGRVRVVERRPMPPMGHFSLIRFERMGGEPGVAAKLATDGRQYA